jgi:hypothetical protein
MKAAMLRNVEWSMFNERKGYDLRGWREYDRSFNIEN